MFILVEQLKETIKSYTIAAAVANESQSQSDFDYANKLLDQINQTRISLAMQAEMRQVFWDKLKIPAASNVASIQNIWYSRNDQNYILRRGLANLDNNSTISFLNQGDNFKVITRDAVSWQQVFGCVQTNSNGVQTQFDWLEALLFAKNQALNVAIGGQTDVGYLYFHGATLKDMVPDGLRAQLQAEFLNDDGTTKYLPQTQLIPLTFQFPAQTNGSIATDGQGNTDIYSVKNDRSVLVLGVSTTAHGQYTIDRLDDEARNLTIASKIEVEGVAASYNSFYQNYYDLPYPHLFRAGDRFKLNASNGGATNNPFTANTNTFLTFHGITL